MKLQRAQFQVEWVYARIRRMEFYRLRAREVAAFRNEKPLFDPISFEIEVGECLSILGCNGSGKTTLLRILASVYQNYHGEIFLDEMPFRSSGDNYRAQLCYVGHRLALKDQWTVFENLFFQFQSLNEQKIEFALEFFQLAHLRKFLVSQLSQGQRQRLALTRLLLNDASIWVLDEPFASLDVDACQLLNQLIDQHLAKAGLVMIATHLPLVISTARIKKINLRTSYGVDNLQ